MLFNANKQQASRILNITMDKIEMKSNFNNSNNQNGMKIFRITISGFSLVGAEIESNSFKLKKCTPDSKFKHKINEIRIDYLPKVRLF